MVSFTCGMAILAMTAHGQDARATLAELAGGVNFGRRGNDWAGERLCLAHDTTTERGES